MRIDRNQGLIATNLIKYYEMCRGDSKSTPKGQQQLADFREIKSGICAGLVMTHGVMNLPSSARWGLSEWWDDVLTKIVLWDGSKVNLEQRVMLKNGERVKTLQDIFDWFNDVVLFIQDTTLHPVFAVHDTSLRRLQFLIKNADLLTPTEQMMIVEKVYKVSGRFSAEKLEKILDDKLTKAFIEKNVCEVSYEVSNGERHAIGLRYEEGKGWFLFDPNYSTYIDTRVFKQEIYFSSTKKLAEELIAQCNSILTILGIALAPVQRLEQKKSIDEIQKQPFAVYDQIVEQQLVSILKDGGLGEFISSAEFPLCDNHFTPEIKSRVLSAVGELTLNELNKTRSGFSPLFFAIHWGFYELASTLIKRGVDVNHKSQSNKSPLMLICERKEADYELFNLLLEHKAEINIQDDNGNSLLMYAARYGHEDMVRTLLAKGARTDFITKNNKNTASMFAMCHGHVAVTKQLLAASSVLINLKEGFNYERLKFTILEGHVETANLFIEKLTKDSLDVTDEEGQTILMWAAGKPTCLAIVELLLARGANPNATCKLGQTALMKAAYSGSLESAKALLKAKARLDLYDKQGQCALIFAIQNKQQAIQQLFLQAIQNHKDVDFLEKSNLLVAKSDIISLQFYITRDEINQSLAIIESHPHLIDLVDEKGNSTLMIAARCGDSKSVEWLLARKPPPNLKLKNKAQQTAWQLAVRHGWYGIAGQLFEGDYKDETDARSSLFKAINREVGNQTVPLIWWALKSAKAPGLEWLVKNSADKALAYRDSKGATLLMAAIATGDAGKVRIMLKEPRILAQVDSITKQKTTALSMATKMGRFDIVKLIADCGVIYPADVSDIILTELVNRCDYPLLDYLLEKNILTVTLVSIELSLTKGNSRMAGMLMNAGVKLIDIPLKDIFQLSEIKGEYLLQKRLDIELKDESRVAMFKASWQAGHMSTAKLLLESENFSEVKSFLKTFKLTIPAAAGCLGSLMAAIKLTGGALNELLTKHGLDIQEIDQDSMIRKSLAKEIKAKAVTSKCDYLMVNNLLAKKISVLAVTADSLELALSKGDFLTAFMLINAGLTLAGIALKNLFRLTPVKDGKQTLELRAGIELKDEQSITMLKEALGAGHIAIARLLLKLDDSRDFKFFLKVFELTELDGRLVNVNIGHSKYGSPLLIAVRLENEGLVHYLVRHGANIYYPDQQGKTAQSLADEIKNDVIINPRDIDQFNYQQFSSLRSHEDNLSMLSVLDPNRPDHRGETLLHYAVKDNHPQLTEFLLAEGAKNLPNYDQETPLIIAATRKNLSLSIILLNFPHLDNLDFEDNDGKTAMYYLAVGGYLHLAKSLSNKGADCTQALEVAVDRNKPAIIDELVKASKSIKISPDQLPKLLLTALKKSHWQVAYVLFANWTMRIEGQVLYKLAEQKQSKLLKLFMDKDGDVESALQLALAACKGSGGRSAKSSLLLLVNLLGSHHLKELMNKREQWQQHASVTFFVESLNNCSMRLGFPNTDLIFPDQKKIQLQ